MNSDTLPDVITVASGWVPPVEADSLLKRLTVETPWQQRTVTLYGRTHPQPRLSCWYGPADYTYSGSTHPALPMPSTVEAIRRRIAAEYSIDTNSCLLNLYRTGDDTVGMHADDEPELGPDPIIPTLVLGAPRAFALRHTASGQRWTINAGNGDLLIMGSGCQQQYTHGVPRRAKHPHPRISLTFRQRQ